MRTNCQLVIIGVLDLLDVLISLVELSLIPHFEPLLQILVRKCSVVFSLPLVLLEGERFLVFLVLHDNLVDYGLLLDGLRYLTLLNFAGFTEIPLELLNQYFFYLNV